MPVPAGDTVQVILANLNLVVPVVAAVLVIIVAIIVICVLRGKGNYHKGKPRFVFRFIAGTIPPVRDAPDVKMLFPWLPEWVDLNIAVPIAATIVVVVVGIVTICVALSRRTVLPSQTRLRNDCRSSCSAYKTAFVFSFVFQTLYKGLTLFFCR